MFHVGKAARDVQHQVISSGSIALDSAIGIGGFPRGRVTEIFGPESSGKTTLALHVIAVAQKAGGTATFIDAEHALDPVYAAKLGVDTENLFICQPDTGEQALEIADSLVRRYSGSCKKRSRVWMRCFNLSFPYSKVRSYTDR